MRNYYIPFVAAGIAGLMASTAPRAVLADSAAEAAPNGSGTEIEEVVVTAQKRSEDVRTVPISISAMSGFELEEQHIRDYDDISRAVPGVSFNSVGASEGLTNIVIRGISSTSGSATVGIYLDDVSMTVKNFYDGASQPKIFDLDRIEVLRGPQGTLWGASSMGGTVRFVTKQPVMDQFSVTAATDLSGTDHANFNYGESAIVNVPLIDGTAALRASLSYTFDSGYIDHYTQSGQFAKGGVNDERALVFRATGKVVPDDGLIITPGLFFQRDKTSDNDAFYPALGLWKQSKQVVEYGRDTLFLPSLTATKDLGFADLTSVSGFFWRQYSRQQDGTFYNSTLFAQAFLDTLPPDPNFPNFTPNAAADDSIIGNLRSPVRYDTHYSQVSQELRLSSHPGEGDFGLPLKWTVGLYYTDQWVHNTNFQQIPGINKAFQQIYGVPMEQSPVFDFFGGPGITRLFPDDVDEADEKFYEERQYAIFGQIDYDVLPDLHASVGLRYLYARNVVNFSTYGFYQIGNISPFNQVAHFYALTPKYTVTYDIDASSNVYASASKGYRLGGPEPSPVPFGPTTVCAGDFANLGVTSNPLKFNSDKLWSYELGSKNRFFGNTLSVDGAGYYISWKDIQQQLYLPTCGYYFTANIGDAEIYGGELEVHYKPIAGLTLGLTGSYQHAAITSTNNPSTVAVGQRLIDVPYITYTFSAQYDYPVNDTTTVTARADFSETGHSYGSYQVANSNYYNPSYGVLNVGLGLSTEDYDVTFYVKNLNDNRTIIQSPEINTVVEGYTVRPRTIGITAKANFGS